MIFEIQRPAKTQRPDIILLQSVYVFSYVHEKTYINTLVIIKFSKLIVLVKLIGVN